MAHGQRNNERDSSQNETGVHLAGGRSMGSILRHAWHPALASSGLAAVLACGGSLNPGGADGGAPEEADSSGTAPMPSVSIECVSGLRCSSDDAQCQIMVSMCLCIPGPPEDAGGISCSESQSAEGVTGALGLCCTPPDWGTSSTTAICSCEQMSCKMAGSDSSSCHCDGFPPTAREMTVASCPSAPSTVSCINQTLRQCTGNQVSCPCGYAVLAGPCEAAAVLHCPPGSLVSRSSCAVDAGVVPQPDAAFIGPPPEGSLGCGSSSSSGGSGSGTAPLSGSEP